MIPSDLARYGLITLVLGTITVFGLKIWNKGRAGDELVAGLRALTADASMFEQFNQQDAGQTLLKAVHTLHLAQSRFGLPPDEALDRAFKIKKESLLDSTDPDREEDSPRQALVREALLRNYENAKRLGFFTDSLATEMLSRGETPLIKAGKDEGKTAEIGFLIDPAAFPGAEKIIPNLLIRPPVRKDALPDTFQIAQCKRLAEMLENAQIIERESRENIVAYYDKLGKPEEEPEPEPEAESEPEAECASPDPGSAGDSEP